ncbi:MAG TPA: cobalt-precorrin-6A reductase [Paenirhodobacter sp.]
MRPILILGGTTEASQLAAALDARQIPAILSYAGRTAAPRAQPVPVRIGGFGGADGLAAWLRTQNIGRVIDATHPFAAQISRNAIAASAMTGVPLLVLERPAWVRAAADRWTRVADIAAAVAALPPRAHRIFLAIGRQHLAAFAARRHHYLLRLVDPPTDPLPLPDCHVEIARGPFDVTADIGLLRDHRIDLIVAKNAGGTGAEAKLTAARTLGLPVIMIDRPVLPPRDVVATVSDVLARLHADLGV